MTAALFALALLMVLVGALEANHRRQRPHAPYGSADVPDRDAERVANDLRVGRADRAVEARHHASSNGTPTP